MFNFSIPPEVAKQRQHRSNLGLNNPCCQELVAAIAKRGVAVDPTLVVFRDMIYLNDLPLVRDHPDQRLVPARMRQYGETFRKRSNLQPATLAARERGPGDPQGRPPQDICHTREIDCVIRAGRVVVPAELLKVVPAE